MYNYQTSIIFDENLKHYFINLLLLNQSFFFVLCLSKCSEIGIGLTGFGVFFLFFGMILFFDKALLAIGNVSWWVMSLWCQTFSQCWQPEVKIIFMLCLCVFILQILFVSGLSFVIGLERTFRFFFQRHKVKATSFFLGGVFVVLIGWPIIGVVLEIYGFFLLFRWVYTKRRNILLECKFNTTVDFSFVFCRFF